MSLSEKRVHKEVVVRFGFEAWQIISSVRMKQEESVESLMELKVMGDG